MLTLPVKTYKVLVPPVGRLKSITVKIASSLQIQQGFIKLVGMRQFLVIDLVCQPELPIRAPDGILNFDSDRPESLSNHDQAVAAIKAPPRSGVSHRIFQGRPLVFLFFCDCYSIRDMILDAQPQYDRRRHQTRPPLS